MAIKIIPLDHKIDSLRAFRVDPDPSETVTKDFEWYAVRNAFEYCNRIISMYKKGLEDIEAYLYEHASDHDGYRIRLDVSEIIRDVEKAVDKAGEL